MDPMWVAVIGSLLSALLLKVADKDLFGKLQTKELLSANTTEDAAPNDATRCTAYEVRLTQAKMVEAGIIDVTEMSVCDNDDCLNCLETHKAIRRQQRLAYYAEKNELAKIEDERRIKEIEASRINHSLGYPVRIPMGVPDRAHVSVGYEYDDWPVYHWKWIDSFTGEKMYMKSLGVREDMTAESYEVHSGQSNKPLRSFTVPYDGWVEVRDPDSNKLLGHYHSKTKRVKNA